MTQNPKGGRWAVAMVLIVVVAALGTLAASSWPPTDQRTSDKIALQMRRHYEAERDAGARFVYFYSMAHPDGDQVWAMLCEKRVRAGKVAFVWRQDFWGQGADAWQIVSTGPPSPKTIRGWVGDMTYRNPDTARDWTDFSIGAKGPNRRGLWKLHTPQTEWLHQKMTGIR